MTITRAIATRPGEPPQRRDYTPAEEAAYNAEGLIVTERRSRAGLREGFKAEALQRIGAVEPAWDTFEEIGLIASVWHALSATAPVRQRVARDLFQYARASITRVATLDPGDLAGVDPTAAKPFLAVDPADGGWPT